MSSIWRGFGVAAAAAALVVTTAAPPAWADDAPDAGIPVPQVDQGRIDVVVMLADQPDAPSEATENRNLASQDELIESWAEKFDLQLGRQFGYLANGFSASIPADQLLPLSAQPEVESVKKEALFYPNELEDAAKALVPNEHSGRELEGVPAAHAATGADGTGTVIAIIDSGIDPSHQDMKIDDCGSAKIKTINESAGAGFTCKVPNGYNYADENYEVKDTTASQHGMHVAGISAANGLEDGETFADTGRIEGVAPNAQLLAMKVFSNDGEGGARDSDIIAAIEDSVKLGADIINMSLGSDNGHNNTSSGTYRALDAARDKGVLPVISAGNSGLNFSPMGYTDDAFGLLDDGTLGNPGSLGNAFTVASIENSKLTENTARVSIDGQGSEMGYSLATGTPSDTAYEVVDAGLGRAEDLASVDLSGKLALIERGGNSFAEKYANAVSRGAAAILVYNSAGNEGFIGMGGIDDFTVPSGSLQRADGLKLRDAVRAGSAVTVALTSGMMTIDNPVALHPSDFTGWGPTPSLDFKPQIAGIGGSVYSTLNDNAYGTKSGTSMAAPNVTGESALLTQVFAQRYPDLGARERTKLIETALMNTAQILEDNGVPFAPRQMGAGLGRVDKALETTVYATVDGEPSVALREVNGAKTFTVTLTNHGTQDASYSVPSQRVIGETNGANEITTSVISDETLTASSSSVTVPAGGTAEVSFTLTPKAGENHYIEGWAELKGQGVPDISIPYLGFVGDWNAEPIIKAPGEAYGLGNNSATGLLTLFLSSAFPLDSDLGTLALSPNGDDNMDMIVPAMMFMRSASDVEYEIHDANGDLVVKVGGEQNMSRISAARIVASDGGSAMHVGTSGIFEGVVWDASQGKNVVLPDGEYTYQVKARLSADFDWQTVDIPFRVDTTKPVVEIGEPSNGKLPFTVKESGGLFSIPSAKTEGNESLTVTQTGDMTFEVELPDGTPFVNITAMDNGFNLGKAGKVLTGAPIGVPKATTINSGVLGPYSADVFKEQLIVEGVASSDMVKVTIAGKEYPVKDGRFFGLAPLTEGENTIEIIGYNADGNEVGRLALTPTYDSKPPTVELTGLNENGRLDLADDGTVTLTGTITDEREGAQLSAKVLKQDVEVTPVPSDSGTKGTFSVTVKPDAKARSISVSASDGANTRTASAVIEGRMPSAANAWRAPWISNAMQEVTDYFVEGTNPDATENQFVVRGTRGTAEKITFTGATRVDDSGTFVTPQPIEAQINEDGTFEAPLPMKTGINSYRFAAWDADGTKKMDYVIRFFFDATMPTITFDEPTLIGGTLYANSDEVTFAGEAEDDGWGYKLMLNGSSVVDIYDRSGLGPESNKREFSEPVAVKNGDQILVYYRDANSNALAAIIPVIVDKVNPEVAIAGVEDGARLSEPREITSTASDEHLASMQVTLNGEVIDEQSTELSTETVAVQDVLTDVNVPKEGESSGNAATQARAVPAADLSAEALETAATGTLTTTTQTELSSTLDTSSLATGEYTLTVQATDLAGNTSSTSKTFTVDAEPVIEGPDPVELTATPQQIADQTGLIDELLGHFTVVDDGAVGFEGDTTLSVAPGTVLTAGENTVTLIARDAAGRFVEREVTVIVSVSSDPGTPGEPGEPGDPSKPDRPGKPGRPLPSTGGGEAALLGLALVAGALAASSRRRKG